MNCSIATHCCSLSPPVPHFPPSRRGGGINRCPLCKTRACGAALQQASRGAAQGGGRNCQLGTGRLPGLGRCHTSHRVVSYIARGPFKGDNDDDDSKKRKRFQDASYYSSSASSSFSQVDLGAGFSTSYRASTR